MILKKSTMGVRLEKRTAAKKKAVVAERTKHGGGGVGHQGLKQTRGSLSSKFGTRKGKKGVESEYWAPSGKWALVSRQGSVIMYAFPRVKV